MKDSEPNLKDELLKIVHAHDVKSFKELIKQKVDLNWQYHTDKNSLLHEAVGAMPEDEDNDNATLIVLLLLDNGADIYNPNLYGQTALHIAILTENTLAARILLEYGADPDIEDYQQRSAQKEAEESNKKDLLSLFNQAELQTITTYTEELQLVDVPKDGNCLFHAIARQLQIRGHTHTHESLRAIAIDYVLNHPNDFEGFTENISLNQYIDEMLQIGSWADHPIIRALSLALSININIYQPGQLPTPISPEFGEIINIAYTNGNHYQSLEPSSNISSSLCNDPELSAHQHASLYSDLTTDNSDAEPNSSQQNNALIPSLLATLACCFESIW